MNQSRRLLATPLMFAFALWVGASLRPEAGEPSSTLSTLPSELMDLKPGPGAELVTSQCVLCHSLDYITTQPPLSTAQWTANVAKMVDKYGAPIPPAQTTPIVRYLVRAYGRPDPPPPTPAPTRPQ